LDSSSSEFVVIKKASAASAGSYISTTQELQVGAVALAGVCCPVTPAHKIRACVGKSRVGRHVSDSGCKACVGDQVPYTTTCYGMQCQQQQQQQQQRRQHGGVGSGSSVSGSHHQGTCG
jgi:hypothetical protein